MIRKSVINLEVMPSMRLLTSAGPAHRRENISGYNCCYMTVNSPDFFSDLLYILMNGCGVGYSVESKYVNELPLIPHEFKQVQESVLLN